MKKKNIAVFIYVPLLALLIAVTGFLLFADGTGKQIQSQEQVIDLDEYFQTEQTQEETVQTVDEKNVENGVLPSKTAELQQESSTAGNAFVLGVVDGHVAVFESGETEVVYMYTGILLENLPQSTQQEVLAGKEILDEQALYFFLETYSS